MITREPEFNPPHKHAAHWIMRYFDELMHFTYQHPALANAAIQVLGVSSLALLTSTAFPLLPSIAANRALMAMSTTTTLLSAVSAFAQHKVFGFPVDASEQMFTPQSFEYKSAKAEVILEPNCMPRLSVTAENNYDAGYAEGHILGESIRSCLNQTSYFKPIIRVAMMLGLDQQLDLALKTVPANYQEEMKGKVEGYNKWLATFHPGDTPLTLEYYFLLHLLPDLKNYKLIGNNRSPALAEKVSELLSQAAPRMGCTSIAIRLGEYTFFTRVLDWFSYGAAGKYFLQMDRNIKGAIPTIDIGLPLISGALTILNQHGMLLEMNVAHGMKVETPKGMPAVFFNRYCAESVASPYTLETFIVENKHKPLGAYHLTATDGIRTHSYHFYQSPLIKGAHAMDDLNANDREPQLLVVANNGFRFEGDEPHSINHSDSNQRKDNIYQLFHHQPMHDKFTRAIQLQKTGLLSTEELKSLLECCLLMAKLPLVNNSESVLCALYVYHQDKLQSACAITDNMFAQSKPLSDFKQLRIPR